MLSYSPSVKNCFTESFDNGGFVGKCILELLLVGRNDNSAQKCLWRLNNTHMLPLFHLMLPLLKMRILSVAATAGTALPLQVPGCSNGESTARL